MKYGKWKRVMGALLAASLICASLVGCSKGGAVENSNEGGGTDGSSQGNETQDAGEQTMGRFLEEELDIGGVFGNIFDMKKLEDGSVRIAGSDGNNGLKGVWDSKDAGATWEKASISRMNCRMGTTPGWIMQRYPPMGR